MALRGYIVGQITALKPCYVPIIPGPKGAGHSNDWCIKFKDFLLNKYNEGKTVVIMHQSLATIH